MSNLLLALDYGGSKLSAAITIPGSREWLGLARVQSPPNHDARYDQSAMLDLARKLLNRRQPSAIGVSFGGPVDASRGVIILSHHVPGWGNLPLRDQLQNEFGVPASVDNDANVAALGEYKFGAGQNCASLLYVTVSTGVGGGWVLDGKIFHGADAMAGEIGHTVVDPRGLVCICSRRGCVEVLACGPAIARAARERLSALTAKSQGTIESDNSLRSPRDVASDRDTQLHAFSSDRLDELTAADVARAAKAGDQLAQEILDDAACALGFGIGTAITLMNPERVVIGGGVSKSGERWWRGVRESARANTLPQMRVDIVPAALADDAPLWGAVALAEGLLG